MLDEMGIPSAILPDYDDGVTEMVHTPADVTPKITTPCRVMKVTDE